MTTSAQALENVYTSLLNDNEDIDAHLTALKDALKAEGKKEVTIDPTRLAQNNRQGRKMLVSYFKRRGVSAIFAE